MHPKPCTIHYAPYTLPPTLCTPPPPYNPGNLAAEPENHEEMVKLECIDALARKNRHGHVRAVQVELRAK